MIRTQTLLAALAATLSFSAAVASASTDAPAGENAQRLTLQDQSRVRLSTHDFALQQIEWQRQMQRQLEERERIKALTILEEDRADGPLELQSMAQNRIQTREQIHTQAHVRTQKRTESFGSQTSGSGSSGRGGSGKR